MAYQGRQPGIGIRNRFIYTATSGQTTFSGSDSNGLSLAYQDGAYVDVYLNGVLLIPVTDYASTTKTSVTLTTGATSGDAVEIVCYDIASIADTVSSLNGGTFKGAVVFEGGVTGAGGASGGGTNQIFYENGQTVTVDYTIVSTKNAMSTGPIDVDSGITVTVESGARWVIL